MRIDGFVRQKGKEIHSYVKVSSAWLKSGMEQKGERMMTVVRKETGEGA